MRLIKAGFILFIILSITSGAIIVGGYLYLNPKLPSIEGLSDVQLQVPLRIYSSEGALMGEFGEKRRTPKRLDEIPLRMQQAFLSAEDDRFYHHPGVDYQGILRAALNLIRTGKRGQGGSTITMQLARNFYLSNKKTYLRKINEILLALKIEHELTKRKILELYLNKIYLGVRAYGVAAAAQVYYGAKLEDLTLAQTAMIAGLPKAPSSYNPVVNPERAIIRRNYVLTRMHYLGYINTDEFKQAESQPVTASRHRSQITLHAPYVDEMIRAEIVKQFGKHAYSKGLRVYTTLKKRLQIAANDSLWNGLVNYDKRHGYRGVVRHVDISNLPEAALPDILKNDDDYGRFKPALVLKIDDTAVISKKAEKDHKTEPVQKPAAIVMLKSGEKVPLFWDGLRWARRYISVNRMGPKLKKVSAVIKPGDVIWVDQKSAGNWVLAQIPAVQGALVSVNPNTGAINALVGGFDFQHSKFNRVTQARRQPGSGFKPVIYSAALAKSFTPATLINDAPVVFKDAALEGDWRPENYSGKVFGPTRLRKALYTSRNLVSIRILRAIKVSYAINFAKKFGFKSSELPHDLSLALGSCEVSPLQMSRAFSVFANGGFLIKPYIIQKIEDYNGNTLYDADPVVACPGCLLKKRSLSSAGSLIDNETLAKLPKQAKRTLEPRLAFQMNSILQDVILRGTGRRALVLGRKDLAGKTGTTNDQRDAWFNGYNPDIVTNVWVGFDQLKPLGSHETGSRAALPIWIDFMRVALQGKPEKQLPRPDGLVTVKINAKTGEAATDKDTDTIFEIFRKENAPKVKKSRSVMNANDVGGDNDKGETIPEQLF